jgi:putative methionine-R-sulfoxide reductase with GAF domain
LNGLKVERDALFNDEDSEEEEYHIAHDSMSASELV